MARFNIVARAICAGIVVVGIVAISNAAMGPSGKSYNQCQREARSLGYNLNDEADIAQANLYISKCQHGEHVRMNAYNEAIPRSERVMARREQVDRRPPRRDDYSNRRALAQVEPKYRQQEVRFLGTCRDLAVTRAWNFFDEEDISQAHRFVQDCMRGKIPR